MSSMNYQIATAVYPLAVGLFASSGVFFGNLGLTLAGPLPIIQEQLGDSTLSAKQKLTVWRLFFDQASAWVIGGTLISAAFHLGAIPLLDTPNLKQLAAGSAALSLSILPYTLYAVFPTINTLKVMDKRASLGQSEEKEVVRLIKKWDTLHKVRYAMYGPAWGVSLITLLGAFST